MAVKVFVFDWNGEDIRICSSTNDIPTKWYQITNDHVNCFRATFMKKIQILMSNCDIAVFSTQTNPDNDYFHEYILKNSLEQLGYTVDTEESNLISDIGTKLKLSVCYKIKLEKFNKHGFIFKDNYVNVKIPIIVSQGYIVDDKTYTEALALYYTYREETFVFIAVSFAHLNDLNRKRITRNQNDCLEYFIKHLIKDGHIDYGFISGDMNYQINKNAIFNLLENINKTSDFKNIIQYDELYPNLDEFNVNEGVDGQGPLFMPTYALKDGRSLSCREMNLSVKQDIRQDIRQNIKQSIVSDELSVKIRTHVKNYVSEPTMYNKSKLTQHINELKLMKNKKYERLIILLERITGVKKYQGDTNKELHTKINLELTNIGAIKEKDVNNDLNKIIKDNVKMYKINKSNAVKNLIKENLKVLKSLNIHSYDRLIELLERLTADAIQGNDTMNQIIDKIILMLSNMDKININNINNVDVIKPKSPKINNVSECYKSKVAYHNRILNTVDIKCLTYDRIDIANNTEHSAVYGLYSI